MSHNHSIYDSDKRLVIDSQTRTIKIDKTNKPILAQYDHNSEYVTFEMDRFVENHDLSLCDKVEVHYNNFDSEMRSVHRGFYETTDLHVDTGNSNKVVFTWIISDNATKYEGPLYFIVSFVCLDDEGYVSYRWNTVANNYFDISSGINNTEYIEKRYADVLEQWKEDLFTLSGEESTNILVMANNKLAEIEAKGAAVKDSIPDDYTSLEGDVFHSSLFIRSEDHLDDLNNATANRVYIISLNDDATVLNMPNDERHGTLLTFKVKDVTGGHVQFFISSYGNGVYYRINWGDSVWKAWELLAKNEYVTKLANTTFQAYGFITSESQLSDLNNAEHNRAYSISLSDSANVLNMPKNERNGTLLTFCRDTTDNTGAVQFYISSSGRFYMRICWGSSTNWSEWRKQTFDGEIDSVPLTTINSNAGLLSCFLNVGCIGDSLASGESVITDSDDVTQYVDIYKHSWPQYLARMTGNKYYNWSSGGRTCATWLSSSYATECFDGEHKCEAYIIGLGQNDYNQNYTIGTLDDIALSDYNNNTDSFYGNYGKIIQKIKEIQPSAKIFILTDPSSATENGGYNAAIRSIAEAFDNVYLVDLYTYGQDRYNTGLIAACKRNGHYNAIAYREMSLIIATYIDWIIRNNIDEFKMIEFIGSTYDYGS